MVRAGLSLGLLAVGSGLAFGLPSFRHQFHEVRFLRHYRAREISRYQALYFIRRSYGSVVAGLKRELLHKAGWGFEDSPPMRDSVRECYFFRPGIEIGVRDFGETQVSVVRRRGPGYAK